MNLRRVDKTISRGTKFRANKGQRVGAPTGEPWPDTFFYCHICMTNRGAACIEKGPRIRIVYTDLCSLSICIMADLFHRIAKLLENLFSLLSRSFLLTSSQVVLISGWFKFTE